MQFTANQINATVFVMVDATDTELSGLTLSVAISKNGAAFVAGTGTASEIGSGWYKYILPAAECDTIGPLAIKVTAPGARQQNLPNTVAYASGGAMPAPPVGSIAYTYTLLSTVGSVPLPGASVWVTTDLAGANAVALGTTDAAGIVVFNLQPGTYYFWRALAGYEFSNPDTEVVS